MKRLILFALAVVSTAAFGESANKGVAYRLEKSIPITTYELPEAPVFERNRRIWQTEAECYAEISLPIVVSNTIYYALKDSNSLRFSASLFNNSTDRCHVFSSMSVGNYNGESWWCITFDVANWSSRFSVQGDTVTVWYIVDDTGSILTSSGAYRTDLRHIALGYFHKSGDTWTFEDALEKSLLSTVGLSVALGDGLLGDGERAAYWTCAESGRFICRPQWVCADCNTNVFLLNGEWRNAIAIVDGDGLTTRACLLDKNTYSNMFTTCERAFVSTYQLTSTNFTAEAARQFVREYRQIGPRMRAGTVVRIR